MLAVSIHNAFSACTEKLVGQVSQLSVDHHRQVSALEELERWLSRRSQVLHLQRTVLEQACGASPCDDASGMLMRDYHAGLDDLQHGMLARYREMITSRMPENKSARIVALDGSGMVLLDANEVERRVATFGQRLADEMAAHRQFSFGTPAGRDRLRCDLRQEWESIERTLVSLKDRIDECSMPSVEAKTVLMQQLAAVRREREAALLDAGYHQGWCNACAHGDIRTTTSVLAEVPAPERAAFVNRLGPDGRSAFHRACEEQDLAMAALLLRSGADVAHPTDIGRLPVHLAARRDHAERTRTFLCWLKLQGANPLDRDCNGRTALDEAAYHGNVTAAAWLIAEGLPVDDRGPADRTALHIAASRGHTGLVRFLLQLGANPAATNAAGERPIFEAIRAGQGDCMEAFLDIGVWLTAAERQQLQRGMLGAEEVHRAYRLPLERALATVGAAAPARDSGQAAPDNSRGARRSRWKWLNP